MRENPEAGSTPQAEQPLPARAKAPEPAKVDEDRDDFIKNALPVAAALRRSGKLDEAKKLEQVAQAIWQTKSMTPTPAGEVAAKELAKEETVKDALAAVFKAIDQVPALKNSPEAKGLRRASERLDKDGMLNITMRGGVVVSFVSNFSDNFSRTQGQVTAPTKKAAPAATTVAATPAPAVAPVTANPAPAPAVAGGLAYTSYAPTTETGIIEQRKTTPLAAAQMNVALTDKGEFGLNPQVNQERLIGDGISKLAKFFEYEMPTSGLKIAKVGLAEPGRMQLTEKGWEVVTKGKLSLTDTAGNTFTPALSAAQQVPAPAQVQATAAAGFAAADIPTESLKKLGLSVKDLEQSGQLQRLLEGKKTDLIPGLAMQGVSVPFSAKLVLERDPQGEIKLRVDLPKRELQIPEQVMGKDITPAMKQQLETVGLVPLADGFRDGQGNGFAGYLAVDHEMKRVVAVRPEGITLPKQVYGVTLSAEQSKLLLEGRPAHIEGMRHQNQQPVNALVQLDPIHRKLVFRDAKPLLMQEQTLPPARRASVRV
jgi:hypothetical protein